MLDFLKNLFDTSPYPQRWMCGTWSQTHGWLHIISDIAIWGAYMAIPIILIYFTRRRKDVPFLPIFWLFGIFIMACGTGHLIEAGLFYWPVYRLSGAVKLITALVSWTTVIALIPVVPKALSLRSTEVLETEVQKRTRELEEANRKLQAEIAERERIEQALRESEQKYQQLYESAPDMFVSVNPETSIVEKCNQTLIDKLGYSREEIVGKSVFDLYHPECHEEVRRVLETFISTGEVRHAELSLMSQEGTKIDVSLNVSAIRGEDGEILYSSSIWRDITGQKKAEEKFRLAVESAPNAMVMVDQKGEIQLINSETERLFGYKREELLGQSIEMLVPSRFRKNHTGYRKQFFDKPETRAMGAGRDLYGLHKDGTEIPIEIGLNPMRTEEKMLVLSSIIDISERKRSEEKLKTYASELERSNQELEEFAYIASHDLKEPLRGIHNYAIFLLEDYKDKLDDEGQHKLATLQRLSQRMENLINSLLYYSRVDRTELAKVPTDLNKVVKEVLDSLQIGLDENAVEIRMSEKLPKIKCDRVRIAEVYRNLIGNAVKYNDKKEKWIEIGSQKNEVNGQITFYIQDNGIGIREKHLDSIFRIFKRLHGRDKYGGGTGAGLTIVRKIIERHGGKIWAESKPDTGSTFYFTLQT